MFIKNIELVNFRNIKKLNIDFNKNINVIYGENAQGKTNIIEAVYLFSLSKSFRSVSDREAVNFESEAAVATLSYEKKDKAFTSVMKIKKKGKKEIYLNGYKLESTSELLGNVYAVIFTPQHLNLIKDGPSERRKFLDFAISQLSPKYFNVLNSYNKILINRNALLKQIAKSGKDDDTLCVWDERLANYGAYIIKKRLEYITLLKIKAKELHSNISGGKECLEISYKSSIDTNGNFDTIKQNLYKQIILHKNIDLIRTSTTVGPHRDDLNININDIDARAYASQGQQRSAVLSLKLAEAQIIKEIREESPVLLLDDVLSELDSSRQAFILEKITENQVIITTCDEKALEQFSGQTIKIKNGRII